MTSRVLHPSAVLDVVAALAAAHGYARAAVFDADGTLWASDIGDAAFVDSARAGMVSDAMYRGPVRAWAQRLGLSLPDDTIAGIDAIVAAHADGSLRARALAAGLDEDGWRRDYYELQSWIYADQPREAVVDYGRRIMEGGLKAGIFTSMVQLLRDLEAAGVAVHIASASHAALVEAGAVYLGVPKAHVAGMEPKPGLSTSMRVRTYGDHKRDTARARLGSPPLLAFGDSVLFTDRALLESSALPFAVAIRGAHRDAALADPRIILVDP